MKRRILAIILASSLCITLAGCGDSKDLGTLDINDTVSSVESVPELSPSSSSTEEPEPTSDVVEEPVETEPIPTVDRLETEYYEGSYFSITKPAGWQVYEKVFNDGTGIYRICLSVTDPADTGNSIFFMTALEPMFDSEAQAKKMAPYIDNSNKWFILEDLTATSMLRHWPELINLLSLNGFSGYAATLTKFDVEEVIATSILSDTDTSKVTEVIAGCGVEDSDNKYGVYFANDYRKMYYAYLGCTYYISYTNIGFSCNVEKYENYSDTIYQCTQSLDLSGLNAKNSKSGASESDGVTVTEGDENTMPAMSYIPYSGIPESKNLNSELFK